MVQSDVPRRVPGATLPGGGAPTGAAPGAPGAPGGTPQGGCPGSPGEIARARLERAVRAAGARSVEAGSGARAFRWHGPPRAFVLVCSGRLSVRFRTRGRTVPVAECRASAGQDCMPVTAAILSDGALSVEASCLERTRWLELDPAAFRRLVAGDPAFRRDLFAQHARRLPWFFQRVAMPGGRGVDQRIAEWLLENAREGAVETTHQAMAADLVTAREVVSRRLRSFAARGWVEQGRGRIRITGAAALSRLARGEADWAVVVAGGRKV